MKIITYKLLLLIFWIKSSCSYSQKIQEIITLDSIININYALESAGDNVTGNISGNYFWIYKPNWKEIDSVLFYKINLETYKIDSTYGVIPSLPYKIKSPDANTIAVSDKYLLIGFYGTIALFNIENNKLIFNKIFPISASFTYYKIIGNYIVCGQAYNYHPLSDPNKTMIALYDIKTDKFAKDIIPDFINIEFSHFGSNHWIDAYDNKILFSQTTDYHIDIYDTQLNKKDSIERNIKDWEKFDSKIMDRLNKNIPVGHSKVLIDSLSPYEDVVSRIESAHFISDSLILVKYIPTNNASKNRLRMYDVWKLSNNRWGLVFSDLKDEKPDNEDVFTKENFPITEGSSCPIYVDKKHLVLVIPDTPVPKMGNKLSAIKEMEDDYYINNNPVATLFIYNISIK